MIDEGLPDLGEVFAVERADILIIGDCIRAASSAMFGHSRGASDALNRTMLGFLVLSARNGATTRVSRRKAEAATAETAHAEMRAEAAFMLATGFLDCNYDHGKPLDRAGTGRLEANAEVSVQEDTAVRGTRSIVVASAGGRAPRLRLAWAITPSNCGMARRQNPRCPSVLLCRFRSISLKTSGHQSVHTSRVRGSRAPACYPPAGSRSAELEGCKRSESGPRPTPDFEAPAKGTPPGREKLLALPSSFLTTRSTTTTKRHGCHHKRRRECSREDPTQDFTGLDQLAGNTLAQYQLAVH